MIKKEEHVKYLALFALLSSTHTTFAVTPHAYVTDQQAGTVGIINVFDDGVQTIFGFNAPRVVKVTPDGTVAFVGSDDNTVRVIDTNSHMVLPVVVDVISPTALSLSPDGQSLYVLSSNDTVTVVRTSDYSIDTVITGFNKAQDIKVSADGAFAYVTNAGNGTVSVIRTLDNTVTGTITGLNAPIGITFSVDGDFAYVTDSKDNAVYIIRTSTHTIEHVTLGLNIPGYIAVSPNKSYFYVSNLGNSTISTIRTRDYLIVATFQIPSPISLAVTQDADYLYVGIIGTVLKIRLLDDAIVAAFPGFMNPTNINLTTTNAPADTIDACQRVLNPLDVRNEISWHAPESTIPLSYNIYRDIGNKILVGTFPAGTLNHIDPNQENGQVSTYYGVAVYENGFSSSLGSVEVGPTRKCLILP